VFAAATAGKPAGWVFCYPEGMNDETTRVGAASPAEALAALHESMRACSDCGLSAERTQVVFGVGSPDAELMFVGEGPGFHEDKQGEPFVGQAGRLLTELLAGIGLARADVYIANVVKCRPPENRDPAPDEIQACSPHLLEQIAIIRPKIICTLGRFATKLLGETELSMTAVHGKAKERTLAGVPVVIFPVFHPASALYAPTNKKVLEEDFGRLKTLLTRGTQALTPTVAVAGAREEGDSAQAPHMKGAAPSRAGVAPSREGAAPSREGAAPEPIEQLHLW
jgi:uracil-DNA glycosylase family 4